MHAHDGGPPLDTQRCMPLVVLSDHNHREEDIQPKANTNLVAASDDTELYTTDHEDQNTAQSNPREQSTLGNATSCNSNTPKGRCVQESPVSQRPSRRVTTVSNKADSVGSSSLNDQGSLHGQNDGLSLPSKRNVHSVGDTKNRGRKPVQTRKADHSGTKKNIPANMQLQWRIGAAPSAALALSKEESTMTKIVGQASAFHTSMFEIFWGPALQHNAFIYDRDNRVEVFRDSSVTAACLVAVGKQASAQKIIERVLPSMEDLLRTPTPALYLILAELALDLAKTPADNVRGQIKQYLAGRAMSILGSEHPISQLLTINLPLSKRQMLGERLWNAILPILNQSFGLDHYQSSTQAYCQARNMAASGQLEDAINRIHELINRWSIIYGSNSLIVCYTKIELANILVNSGSITKAELIVSDALRTSDIIHQAAQRNEDCHASEKRHRESSIAFPRVACLRTLGKLHSLRGNFGTATHYYSRAVVEGSPALGNDSPVVELAQSDLLSSQMLEWKQSSEQFSPTDLSKLTNIVPSPVC